ncbi:MAG: 4-(cytidine 5'-diphospho)-2-C-methyl-D-erythritol kinase, partial [Clostridia bacterium]|nr:4-(cytidine 5'-diphospho)-2-C-methyl-D-erythritol kinase [Clostridia bacterium]
MAATSTSVTVKGYAKINLHLDITGRLEGGYHSVNTVMQTISLYDTVTVYPTETPCFVAECDKEGVPTDEKNIAVRAAMRFAERVKIPGGARICIEKRIPMAAGMAGGSADAAATLLAMNRLYGEPLSCDELCEIGGTLGADVPFCIVGGTKLADGKGEQLHDLASMPDCVLVAACGGEGVSTPWAYGLLDRTYADFGEESDYRPYSTEALCCALSEQDVSGVARAMYNIFEGSVVAERPVARAIRTVMEEEGALRAMMSGS